MILAHSFPREIDYVKKNNKYCNLNKMVIY